ncbi:SGNH/GDSL hydrolase family protein [Cryobacterium melibiosiphilum]|uniref:SGNH/GDSL hydrolase family protein n=1 Tax=Cryobacterium melibiosiphilum TaxID=995039 RepID=A0A3A5MDD1_9MICO|nr:SGNH/GDSL hydrolase family protein [Cryobacterium melibiosiphilum]RJT88137.1 SGNH/GDSL hydrolase family protein [Cryobacterium melibiosiphilum]
MSRGKKRSNRRNRTVGTPKWVLGAVGVGGVVAIALAFLAVSANRAPESTYVRPPAAAEEPPAAVVEVTALAFIGDSYLAASESSDWVSAVTGQMPVAATASISSLGGSGYVTRGLSDSVFGEHVVDMVSDKTDVVVFFGSRNDAGQGNVGAAATAAYVEALALAPSAKLVVVGPVWTDENVPSSIETLNDELRASVDGFGGMYVDAIAEGWFFNENASLIGSDGVHPSDEGRTYIATLMLPHLTAATT